MKRRRVVHVHDVNRDALSVGMTRHYMTNPSVCSYDASILCQRELAVCSQPMTVYGIFNN